MNILILEDERRNYNHLRRMIEAMNRTFRTIGPAASIQEAVEYMRHGEVADIILADIRLSDGLSFEAFNREPPSVPVIFTTAYDEYAIKAFKYNAIDYLLKPVDADELEAAIRRARQMVARPVEGDLGQLFRQLGQGGYRYRERFLLPWRDGYRQVLVRDVNHVFSENKVSRLRLNDGTQHPVALSMDALEAQLDPERFFRANRQYIIRADSVAYIGNYFNSKLVLHLVGWPDERVVVSREKAPAFKAWMDR